MVSPGTMATRRKYSCASSSNTSLSTLHNNPYREKTYGRSGHSSTYRMLPPSRRISASSSLTSEARSLPSSVNSEGSTASIQFNEILALLEQYCLFCKQEDCDGGGCVENNRCVLCGKTGHPSRECKERWRDVLRGKACFSCATFSTRGKSCQHGGLTSGKSCSRRKLRLLRVLMFGGLGGEVKKHYRNRETFESFAVASYLAMIGAEKCSLTRGSVSTAGKRKRVHKW